MNEDLVPAIHMLNKSLSATTVGFRNNARLQNRGPVRSFLELHDLIDRFTEESGLYSFHIALAKIKLDVVLYIGSDLELIALGPKFVAMDEDKLCAVRCCDEAITSFMVDVRNDAISVDWRFLET